MFNLESWASDLSQHCNNLSVLHIGGASEVCSARCVDKQRCAVAVKRLASTDCAQARHSLRELRFLRLLPPENVLQSLFVCRGGPQRVFVGTPLFRSDLHALIQSKQPLHLDHIRLFVYQLARALKYIHR